MMMKFWRHYLKQIIVTLMLIATIGLMYWHYYGMNSIYHVPLSSSASVSPFNDSINGGQSRGVISFTGYRPTLDCQIIRSNTFAFCGMKISLNGQALPMDLSDKDQIILDIEYQSAQKDTLLVYLNNKETLNKRTIIRANQLTLIPKNGRHQYRLNLDDLFVPSWWVFQQSAEISTTRNIDQVQDMQLTTGDNTQPRSVNFTLHGVTLTGKWISGRELIVWIVSFWTVVAVAQVVWLGYQLNRRYQLSRDQARQLNQINQFLKVERDRMESLAKNDALTGCLNRNGLRDILTALLQQFKSSNSLPNSLILIDLDNFKAINDRFGHDEGDRVLVNLAQLVQSHIRDTDELVRWGGEEFAVICRNTSLEGAVNLANHLREKITDSPLSERCRITASFGVAQMTVPSIEPWFKAADQALYQAKANGRNQVVSQP